eukprot:24080_1
MIQITKLRNTYPIQMDDNSNDNDNKSDNESDNSYHIPKRFIGPITKEIMRDPVVAFDGYVYDRQAIENYLKNHKKSPMTGKKASTLIVFARQQLQSEIQTYGAVNNSMLVDQISGNEMSDID